MPVEVSLESLRKRYASLADDDLLSVYVCAELTPEARELVKSEIASRGLDENDIAEVARIETALEIERNEASARTKRQLVMKLARLILLFFALGLFYSVVDWVSR